MTTANQNINLYEGEDKTIEISVTNTEGGTPVSLTGATAVTWRVSTGSRSDTALFEKTLGSGITLDDDADTDDKIVIALDSADTQGYEGRSLYHECRVVDVASNNHIVAVGAITVRYSNTG